METSDRALETSDWALEKEVCDLPCHVHISPCLDVFGPCIREQESSQRGALCYPKRYGSEISDTKQELR